MKIKLGDRTHENHPQFKDLAKIKLNRPELGLVGFLTISYLCEKCFNENAH